MTALHIAPVKVANTVCQKGCPTAAPGEAENGNLKAPKKNNAQNKRHQEFNTIN